MGLYVVVVTAGILQNGQAPTWLQLVQLAGTVPVKKLWVKSAAISSEKFAHDGGKEPRSLLLASLIAANFCMPNKAFKCW